MPRLPLLILCALTALAALQAPIDARALAQLKQLFPGAVSFSPKGGDPPHFKAYGPGQSVIGYAFWTTELEPLERGYEGPIKILVGLNPSGVLAGIVVAEHHEPYGNFSIDLPPFAAQFRGKSVRDPFRVGADIRAVSRATMTVSSAARAVRNSARRLARQLLAPPGFAVFTHETMGTLLRVTIRTADEAEAGRAAAALFAEIDRLDARLSVWRPGSDVQRINAAAGGAPVRVGGDTIDVLTLAQQAGEWTAGKFDVTFGALAGLWKFDHDADGRVPDAREVARRLPLVDYRSLALDRDAGTVSLRRPGMRVHLGGVGKGYAVDRAAAMLRAAGFHDFLIEFGGDLYASGTAGAGPWRVGLADPRGAAGDSFAAVDLRGAALSTSGDYERAFVRDGVRYHHLLDPDTGQPARGSVSVTIVAPQAALADALSTGVFILGPGRGMALVERLPAVEAVIVTASNEVLISSGLRGRVDLRRPPSRRRP